MTNKPSATAPETIETPRQGSAEPDRAEKAWRLPPPPPSGSFDPATIIGFDDLPSWMQRLHASTPDEPPRTIESSPDLRPPPTASVLSPPEDAANAPGPAAGLVIVTASEELTDAPAAQVSDLTLTRFFWIAGAATAVILAALIVLFG